MDILTLLFTVAVIGFVTWLLVNYVPMPPPFRSVLVGVVILLVLLWLLRILIGPLPRVVVP